MPTQSAFPSVPLLMVTGWLAFASCAAPAAGQDKEPTVEQLAKDPALFLRSTGKRLRWEEPADPAKILGPIYFVGTKGLGVFLIRGSEGHVLLYTGMPNSGPLIEKSVRQLGFKPGDIKLILTGHAHIDHVGGHAHLKQVCGAKIAMMREEQELFESGGRLDFHYGSNKEFLFEPAKAEVVFNNEDEIKLGDISIKALRTAGHTQGSTSYVTKVTDSSRSYTVVFPDGTGINPGYRLTDKPSYPGIEANYRHTLTTLESLQPDVWLAPHNEAYGLNAKLERASKEGAKAWLDLEGYQKWVASRRAAFEAALTTERASTSKSG